MIDYLYALWCRWFPRKKVARGAVAIGGRDLSAEERENIRIFGSPYKPPPPPAILKRFPKYPLGCTLRIRDLIGIVDCIYADYNAMKMSGVVPYNWFEIQVDQPSSQDQIFYSIIVVKRAGPNGDGPLYVTGQICAGENDVELVEGQG